MISRMSSLRPDTVQMPEPVVIRTSRSKSILILIIGIGFTLSGFILATQGSNDIRWVGWSTMVFFGACIPFIIKELLNSSPRLVINDEGIFDLTLGVGVIPWPEIVSAKIRSLRGNPFICLQVQHPELWIAKYSPVQRAMISANKALGFSELNLNLTGIKADPNQLLELILKRIAINA